MLGKLIKLTLILFGLFSAVFTFAPTEIPKALSFVSNNIPGVIGEYATYGLGLFSVVVGTAYWWVCRKHRALQFEYEAKTGVKVLEMRVANSLEMIRSLKEELAIHKACLMEQDEKFEDLRDDRDEQIKELRAQCQGLAQEAASLRVRAEYGDQFRRELKQLQPQLVELARGDARWGFIRDHVEVRGPFDGAPSDCDVRAPQLNGPMSLQDRTFE